MSTYHSPAIFFSVQFPFADVRRFIKVPTGRLPVPSFPFAQAENREFVRSTGMVQDRRNTRMTEWNGEEVFSGAPQALRFKDRLGSSRLGRPLASIKPICTFRRLFSDGVTGRLEVGLRLSGEPDSLKLDPEQVRAVFDACANLSVWVRNSENRFREHKLLEAGPALAKHLLRSTTAIPKNTIPWIEPWWLMVGRPLVLLEHRPMDLLDLPLKSELLEAVSNQDFRLAYLAFPFGKAFIGTWILGSSRATEVDRLRRLRIHLFRLHSEREALRLVLQQYERLGFDPASEASMRLNLYLEKADGLFKRGNRYGLDEAVLLDTAKWGSDKVRPGDVATVLARLGEVRGEIRERVRIYNLDRRTAPMVIKNNKGPVAVIEGDVIESGITMSSGLLS